MSISERIRAVAADVAALEGLCEAQSHLLSGRAAPTREEHEKLCALNGVWVVLLNGAPFTLYAWESWEKVDSTGKRHPEAKWWAMASGGGIVDPRPEPKLSEQGRAVLDRLRPKRTKEGGDV